MKIDKNTINKIARLSRIKLEDKESEDYIKDLNSILDWVEQLNEVNTDKVEPLSNISSSIYLKEKTFLTMLTQVMKFLKMHLISLKDSLQYQR